ncbi:hypothetical protein [Desulfovibrio gilichinskyi]|uniref:Uncharacterized protein n=1 Tax=Desulfovibrio gilichinskyi TaxID=1519643 RepID=A0A1X7E2P5_9BACT|nr:hypothetical protein [Desulfovibrio gilichinskyi]SMF26187.1 hypothetical protein SAMN06295933_2541 [Desulfovibrio gilichinskyi]
MSKKANLKKQNKVKLSLVGIFAIVYYVLFITVGIYSLQIIFYMLKENIFGNIIYTIAYVLSWVFAYFASTIMCIKLLLQHRISKWLNFYSLLWFLEIFWTAWSFIPKSSGNDFEIAFSMVFHFVLAHPYLYYADRGLCGKILAITPPLINFALFLIAWIRPQLFYRAIELKEAEIETSREEIKD